MTHFFATQLVLPNWVQIIVLILSLYPILGAFFWFWGALSYRFIKTNKRDKDWQLIPASKQPFITIMIPAHNEELMIEKTITYLFDALNYDQYEILVLNDGSTDQTASILDELQKKYDRLRIIDIVDNKGKAHAFNIGMFFAKGEYILSNDADTIPEPDALMKYMNFFIHDQDLNTAAVTANMDVQNRTKLIAKSQTVEFSSIVGVIKRSQSALNDSMYAYSGANTMYRKSALLEVNGFRQDRATEDISIAWDQQASGSVPRFAPDIVFHMNVPETIPDLFRQRKRWAKGGTEVWLTNFKPFLYHPLKHIFQLTMFLDSTLSVIWSFFFVFSTLLFWGLMLGFLWSGNTQLFWQMILSSCVIISFEILAGLLQLITALLLDSSGAKLKYLLFAPLYFLFFWMVNPLTIVATAIPAIKTIMGYGSGTWVSPKRQQFKEPK